MALLSGIDVHHACTEARARWLPGKVGDLLHVQSQFWVFARVLVLHLVNHSLVSVVLWFDQPQVIQVNFVTALSTKHVETFLKLLSFLDFFSCKHAVVNPHASEKLILIDNARRSLR